MNIFMKCVAGVNCLTGTDRKIFEVAVDQLKSCRRIDVARGQSLKTPGLV